MGLVPQLSLAAGLTLVEQSTQTTAYTSDIHEQALTQEIRGSPQHEATSTGTLIVALLYSKLESPQQELYLISC